MDKTSYQSAIIAQPEQLPAQSPVAATVPDWLMGCWQRRSITFTNGDEDNASVVIWLQTMSHYGDLRIPPDRIDLSQRQSLQDCSIEELIELSRQQSSGGVCEWDGQQAHWHGGRRFHAFDAWPEPGDLRRIGPCMIEFSPSGAYIEDWRWQAGSDSLLLSFSLESEYEYASGETRQRDGLLLQAGDHMMLILDRVIALPRQAPLSELVLDYRQDKNTLIQLLDLECSYAVRNKIEHSTLPFREGQRINGFGTLDEDGVLIQKTEHYEYRWRLLSCYFLSNMTD